MSTECQIAGRRRRTFMCVVVGGGSWYAFLWVLLPVLSLVAWPRSQALTVRPRPPTTTTKQAIHNNHRNNNIRTKTRAAFSLQISNNNNYAFPFLKRKTRLYQTANNNNNNIDHAEEQDDEEEEVDDDGSFYAAAPLPAPELPLDAAAVQGLTVPQLKQQLRLRGLQVSGRKAALIERLLRSTGTITIIESDGDDDVIDDINDDIVVEKETKKGPVLNDAGEVMNQSSSSSSSSSTARKFAAERGKELIDVTAYLDREDVGKDVKSSSSAPEPPNISVEENDNTGRNIDDDEADEPEVWGAKARIVEDYEGRRVVVDSVSETLVEYIGSNQTYQQALVMASREALEPFLAGGAANQQTRTPAEERVRQLQARREGAARRPRHFDDAAGLDEGDETGIYANILDRDFSDWGKYSQTGVQFSKAEVQGVLLLSDVFGAFSDDTRALAEKIAFECQPAVVMVPDLFQGNPWTGPTDGVNDKGQTYELWRQTHSDLQVSVNIRAAAACLRERYGVSSVVVWGTCYGGGRALEAASGWLPDGNIHDIDGNIGPPLVDPMAVIAWYPTRYTVKELFGSIHKGSRQSLSGEKRKLAVMAVFAGNDIIPGATPECASVLQSLLEEDDRVIDHMVKVFPDQDHGFAHVGLSSRQNDPTGADDRFLEEEFGSARRTSFAEGDAEVACLLSTAFMETYSRVFLPTVGPPICRDDSEVEWGKNLYMENLEKISDRDIRRELEAAAANFVEEPLGGYRIDPTDDSQEEELERLLRTMQDPNMEEGPYKIQPDDDLTTIYAKLTASDDFQLF